MSFRTILYDDGDASTYEAVEVSSDGRKTKRFDTGDFVKDWFNSTKYICEVCAGDAFHAKSSSVDHFIMDGADVDAAYLCEVSEGVFSLRYEYIPEELKFYVPKGRKMTWEELKDYCK